MRSLPLSGRRVIAPPRPATVVFAVCALLVGFGIFSLVAVSNQTGYATFSRNFLYLALYSTPFLLAATARIEVGLCELYIIDLFHVLELPRDTIRKADGSNGVVILTDDGESHSSFAYGSSNLQLVFSSRRFRSSARAISEWARMDVDRCCSAVLQKRRRRVRTATLVAPMLALVAGQILSAILWALQPYLYGPLRQLL